MSRDKMLAEDDVPSVVTVQQSHYEHIQSMAATFLSILLTLIIAIGGLASAGLISVQFPEPPENIDGFEITIDTVVNISLLEVSKEAAGGMIIGSVLSSTFYVSAGIFVIIIGIIKLTSCLDPSSVDPERYIRYADSFSIVSASQMSIERKEEWIQNNSDRLESIDNKFKSAQFNLIFGTFLTTFGSLGVISASSPNYLILSLFLFCAPLFILFSLFRFGYLFVRDVFFFRSLHIVPEKKVSEREHLPSVWSMLLAWEREFKLTTHFDHQTHTYLVYFVAVIFLLLSISVNILTLTDVVFQII